MMKATYQVVGSGRAVLARSVDIWAAHLTAKLDAGATLVGRFDARLGVAVCWREQDGLMRPCARIERIA